MAAWSKFSGASGAHKGITTSNVPWDIALACFSGETIDVSTYVALHTNIDLDGLYDLIEMQEVQASWKHAAARNAAEGSHR